MGWRHQWPEKEPRPKLKRLSNEQKNIIATQLEQGVASSPVLKGLGLHIKASRGRFYLEKPLYAPDEETEMTVIGRVTPISGKKKPFLLDAKKMNGNWYEVIQGTLREVMLCITHDTEGTFHGLGALEKSLRDAVDVSTPRDIEMHDAYHFFYADTKEACTVPEALYHVFGVPISVIAEPREWYAYHRTPTIVDVTDDNTTITVEFSKTDMYFGGKNSDTCVYKKQNGKWDIFE